MIPHSESSLSFLLCQTFTGISDSAKYYWRALLVASFRMGLTHFQIENQFSSHHLRYFLKRLNLTIKSYQ